MRDNQASTLTRKAERRVVLAATIGCGLEFYDFLTYAYFAIQIGETFFPSHDRYLSLMGSLGAFAAGFVGRPIGAWVLGGYGDRAGRKPAMLLSMTMMGLAILTLALTPGYATIGIAAPLIVVLARFVQGLALGGEIGAATVYMVEAGSAERRGRNASCQGVCQGIALTLGALVGLVLSTILDAAALAAYGWRIALLLGVSIVPLALALRRTLPETMPEPVTQAARPGSIPLGRLALIGGALMGTGTIVNYVEAYMTTFGQSQLHFGTSAAMAGQLTGNLVIVLASIAGGVLCDRFGRKPLMFVPQLTFALTIYPAIAWLNASPSLTLFFAVNILLGLLNNINSPALYAWVAENLPATNRSRGFALIYSVPITLFGGSTQLFITWLLRATGTPLALGAFMAAIGLVGVAAALAMIESAPRRLALRPALA